MQLVIVRYIHENKEEQNLPPTGTKKYNIKNYMPSLVFLDAGHSINLWMVTECINMEHDMVDLLPFKYVNNEEYRLE